MFDGLSRGQGKNNQVRKTASRASKELLAIAQKYKETQTITDETAEKFMILMTKFDSAVQELVSRSYFNRFRVNPTEQLYYESMRKMEFEKEDTFFVRNVRKVRNMLAHTYDFQLAFIHIFNNENKFDLFEKSILAVKKIADRECTRMIPNVVVSH